MNRWWYNSTPVDHSASHCIRRGSGGGRTIGGGGGRSRTSLDLNAIAEEAAIEDFYSRGGGAAISGTRFSGVK